FAYGYVPDPHSIFKRVYKLEPAHTIVIGHGGARRLRRYWDVAFGETRSRSEQEIAEELGDRLKEAVKLRTISEVPLGAFLSGGIDSSAVVALLAGLSNQPVRTCSIAFANPGHDESKYVELVARRYRTDQLFRQVDALELAQPGRLAGVYDEPFADSSAVPTYALSQLARQRITVALSGDGGDEIFAGYR